MKGLRFVPDNTNIKFVKLRYLTLFIHLGIVFATLAGLYFKGLNYGVDFTGGTVIEIKTKEKADLKSMRSTLNKLGLGDISLQEFGSPHDVLIRVEQQKGTDEDQNTAVQKIKKALPADAEYRRVESVGPTVGEELKRNAMWAVIWSLLAMLVYIWFRFEWKFGLCAVIALAHDCIAVLTLYTFTSLEFTQSAVMAVLVTAGYSINDTVVIYDRIRENLRKYKAMKVGDLIDKSINDTLSRTVLTSGTTLLSLFALYFFGGEVIASYSLPIICGVAVGTYSSIFLAAPLLMFVNLKVRGDEQEKVA